NVNTCVETIGPLPFSLTRRPYPGASAGWAVNVARRAATFTAHLDPVFFTGLRVLAEAGEPVAAGRG
ncbi:MAG: hypothetical protein ACRDLQ_09650, partial [Solirubrobacterales bacterium]